MSSAYFLTVTAEDFLNAGRSVTGLDFNGDGNGDLVIGADQTVDGSFSTSGLVVIIYGSGAADEFATSTFDLDVVGLTDGSDGFYITGGVDSELGWDALNVGDQNGDGDDDLAIVSRADGTITVLFGDTSPLSVDLSAGVGAAGYTITGLPVLSDDFTVSGGTDVNDDGVADLIIGVSGGSGTDSVHVVFGDATGADVDIGALDGTTGFTVNGLELVNVDGFNIGTVGDLDGNTIDDILLGRPGPDEDGFASGDLVVMRGTATAQPASFDIDDLEASETLVFTGLSAEVAGKTSIAGNLDINGDGFGDLVIGAALDDTAGNNAGAVYVVFGDSGIADSVDLTALNGTNGFMIEGLDADDQLGLVVQSLGDVSGDGRDDLGILTAAGDLYVIYGVDSGTSFAASFNLSTLNGANGFAFIELFDSTPATLSIAGVSSINNDSINDIAVGATFTGGLDGETLVILGGDANFDTLDGANGADIDGTVSFDGLGEVAFAPTDTTIVIGGDTTGELDEDGPSVSGSISITDSDAPDPTFEDARVNGVYGGLAVNAAGNQWTYTLNTDAPTLTVLDALGGGDVFTERLVVTSSDPSASQTITITITGVDDDAVFASALVPSFSEDISQFTSAYTLTDVDDADPSLAGQRFDGANGYVQFNAAGDAYIFFQTNPLLQDLADGASVQETITITDSASNEFDFTVTFTGATEGIALTFTAGDDDIFTSFGDDVIIALGGDDNINPGSGDDNVDAGDGNDTVLDGMGNDTVDGGADNDNITLLTGENTVDGGEGSDYIRTGYKDDNIMGGDGDDVINADSNAVFLFGNDTIDGGGGDDLMSGGAGADTFIFKPNDGNDTIAEFNENNVAFDAVTGYSAVPTGLEFESGIDKIVLDGFSGASEASLFAAAISNTANGVQFSAQGTTILFYNLPQAQLSFDDFIFDNFVFV
ncbi:beta strand repeat-containing protein [Yoonia sp.]|uniref:beta strand repeat-containing protein n=1 Tax=Yoonia sp. TaxID=2212373 RepID=UPI00358E58BF